MSDGGSMLGPWEEKVEVPDAFEPVTGYRAFLAEWRPEEPVRKKLSGALTRMSFDISAGIRPARPVLSSLIFEDGWEADEPMQAFCGLQPFNHDPLVSPDPNCTCGLYAAAGLSDLHGWAATLWNEGHVEERFHATGSEWATIVVAEVAGWGHVVTHERGWRSQFMCVNRWLLPAEPAVQLRLLRDLLPRLEPFAMEYRQLTGDEQRDLMYVLSWLDFRTVVLPPRATPDSVRLEMWNEFRRQRKGRRVHGKVINNIRQAFKEELDDGDTEAGP